MKKSSEETLEEQEARTKVPSFATNCTPNSPNPSYFLLSKLSSFLLLANEVGSITTHSKVFSTSNNSLNISNASPAKVKCSPENSFNEALYLAISRACLLISTL